MVVAKINVDGVCAVAEYRKLIPAGIIGAQVLLDYADDIWRGLRKTVVFRGAVTKDVITDDEVVTIPAEVVAKPNVTLQVGVYGVDAYGNLAVPTLWADLGTVRSAADPEMDITADPSLPVWAQLRAMIGDLDALDTEVKNNLVAAINEAMTKGGGSVDEATIQKIVEDYLIANPPGQGPPGKDGGYYTPSISQPDANTMNISFAPSKEGMEAVPEKSIPLPAGPTGATPNIKIGTVETLAAGSSATASMTGTPENPLLNLGIPQGAPGSGGGGISQTACNLLITVLKACFTQSDQTSNIDALEVALKGGADTPESGITQNGSVLTIISGVSVTQNGSTLVIA